MNKQTELNQATTRLKELKGNIEDATRKIDRAGVESEIPNGNNIPVCYEAGRNGNRKIYLPREILVAAREQMEKTGRASIRGFREEMSRLLLQINWLEQAIESERQAEKAHTEATP